MSVELRWQAVSLIACNKGSSIWVIIILLSRLLMLFVAFIIASKSLKKLTRFVTTMDGFKSEGGAFTP